MLRELQTNLNKATNAMFKAEVAMVTGMGVVKDYTDKTVGFPSAETADNIFFVNKERIPTGINAGRGDMSDYDTNFTSIAEDEPVKLITPEVGERYAVDQYVATGLAVGNVMSVGTDGKWEKATASTVLSPYIYDGTYTDNGRTLAIIEVIGKAKANS